MDRDHMASRVLEKLRDGAQRIDEEPPSDIMKAIGIEGGKPFGGEAARIVLTRDEIKFLRLIVLHGSRFREMALP